MANPNTPMQIKLANLRIVNEYALLVAQAGGEQVDANNLTQCLEVNQQIINELTELNLGLSQIVSHSTAKGHSERTA